MPSLPVRDAAPLLVEGHVSLRDAVKRLDLGAIGVVLVIDKEGALVATLTDGDVRRAILRGIELDAPVSSVAHAGPVSVSRSATRDDVIRIMRERGVRHVPLLDPEQRPVAICIAVDLAVRTRDNIAVIMAGGRGSRLGDLTVDTPKPLIVVGGRPILEILVEQLATAGFTRLVVTVNYLSERVQRHFGDGSRYGVQIDYVEEQEPLGTAGALSMIGDRLGSTFLLLNADLLTTVSFGDLLDAHKASRNDLTLATREVEVTLRYGVVDVDGDRVTAMREKPTLRARANAGMYVCEPEVIAVLPRGKCDMPEVVTAALDAGLRVGTYDVHQLWLDIGELADLERARAVYERTPRAE